MFNNTNNTVDAATCDQRAEHALEQQDYQTALLWYQQALVIRQYQLGEKHKDTAKSHYLVATVYEKMKSSELALIDFQEALSIRMELFGINHKLTAQVLNRIGLLYYNKSDFTKALNYYHQALAAYEIACGPQDRNVAVTCSNIGLAHFYDNNYQEALPWYERTLAIDVQLYGVKHNTTAGDYDSLARVYSKQKNYDKAMELYKIAMGIREGLFGVQNVNTIKSYNNVAAEFTNQRRYVSAIQWYSKAMVAQEETLGITHPDTTLTYSRIAEQYCNLGEYSKAVEWHQKAYYARKEKYGEENRSVADTCYDIGKTYVDSEDYENAAIWYQKAYDICFAVFGAQNVNTVRACDRLVDVYNNLEDFIQAMEWSKRAFSGWGAELKVKHETTATEQQQRYLAFGAILIARNAEYWDTLSIRKNRVAATELLSNWYGVSNREEACRMLQDFATAQRHTTYADSVYKFLLDNQDNPDIEIEAPEDLEGFTGLQGAIDATITRILKDHGFIDKEITPELLALLRTDEKNLPVIRQQLFFRLKDSIHEYKIAVKLLTALGYSKQELTELGSMSAWDYCRVAYVARYSACCQYISAEEAWQYIKNAAVNAADAYANWRQYLAACTLARAIAFPKDSIVFLGVLDYLLNDSGSPCQAVAFKASEPEAATEYVIELPDEETERKPGYEHFNLGLVYYYLENYDKSADQFNKSLAEKEKNNDHLDTALCYAKLADVYTKKQDFPTALEYQKRNVAICVEQNVYENNATIFESNKLAWLYSRVDDYQKSIEYYKIVYDYYLRKYGDNIVTADSCFNIAWQHFFLNEYDQAFTWFNKDLEISQKILGDEDIRIAKIYNGLALVCRKKNDYKQAIQYLQNVLAIQTAIDGSNSLNVAYTYCTIADAYDNSGDSATAFSWRQKALPIFEAGLDENDPNIIRLRELLAAKDKS